MSKGTMTLDDILAEATAEDKKETRLVFGRGLAKLHAIFEDDNVPESIKRELFERISTAGDAALKAKAKGDIDGVVSAYGADLIRVGALELSDAESAAIQAAITALRFTGGSREQFLVSLASLVGDLRSELDSANTVNSQHVQRIEDLEEQWETGGDPADPNSWAHVARERDELQARLDKLEAALGIDLSGTKTKDLESTVKTHVEGLENAAKAAVTTIDAAAVKQAGREEVIAAVKPFVAAIESAGSQLVVRGDKDSPVAQVLMKHGVTKDLRDTAKTTVGLTLPPPTPAP